MKFRLKTSITLGLLIASMSFFNCYALPTLDNYTNEEKIQIIDNEIIDCIYKIDELEKEIKDNETSLEEKKQLLIDTQKQYQSKKDTLSTVNSFKFGNSQNGTLNILEMLLSSDNISEFFKNIELSKLIIQENNKSLK